MASYSYDPLDAITREIRVIDLLPGCGDTIECYLRHIPLLSPGRTEPYEALSYCWGARHGSVRIVVNGRELLVTPNLHAALRYLRGQDSADTPLTLWVDAICINQKDKAEKSVQVPRMRDIYMSCQRAILWLGEHDQYTRPAFDGLQLMATQPVLDEDFIWRDWRSVRRGHPGAAIRGPRWAGSRFLEVAHYSWTFHRLFGRQWFRRLWIVQELALCPRAVVRCGPFQMDWDVVTRVYALWPNGFEFGDHLGALLRIREQPVHPSDEDFLDLMIKAWHKDCEDPRDKIYGLIGLASVRDVDVPVAVDYTTDASNVFTDFTRRYLRKTGNLQTLAICRGCKTASGPSWAIDHEYNKAKDPLPNHLISWHPRFPGALRAGGVSHQLLRRCTPVFDGNFLGLEGYRLDTVVAVSIINRPPPVGSNISEILETFRRGIGDYQFYLDAKRLVPSATLYNPTGQTVMEAFWCTIMGAHPPGPSDQDCGRQRYSSGTLQQVLRSYEMLDRTLIWCKGFLAIGGFVAWLTLAVIYGSTMISIIKGNIKVRSESIHSFTAVTNNRRFFVTADGYMGLGPQTTRVGDHVLIVKGHGAPIVARQRRQWIVVGDCHLHGVMEGEAFEMGKCRPLWFA